MKTEGKISNVKIQKMVEYYKETSGCVSCLQKYPHYLLTLVPKDNTYNSDKDINKLLKTATPQHIIARELEKYKVMCFNCEAEYNWQHQQK